MVGWLMRNFIASVAVLGTLASPIGVAECAPEAGTGQSSKAGHGIVGSVRGVTAVVEMTPSFGRKTAVDITIIVDGNARVATQQRGRFAKVYHPKIGMSITATAYEKGTISCHFVVEGVPQGERKAILEGPSPSGSIQCIYVVDPRDRT